MKTTPLPRAIWTVFLFSSIYWIILAFQSFSADGLGYKDLGSILYHHGLIGYASSVLHREPLYPLLCSWAMQVESLTGITFTHVMAAASAMLLLTAQILMCIIMRRLNIPVWISCAALLYWAVSPTVTSSAFNILFFCEIITYPLILGAVMAGHQGWMRAGQGHSKAACGYGALTGILFTALTLVKAAFECICPAYLMLLLAISLYQRKMSFSVVCFVAAAGVFFYFPIIGYKCLNKKYNGNFAIADRGPQTLYGNVIRRLQQPLTSREYLAGLTCIIGDDLCQRHFQSQECASWSFHLSDNLGSQKVAELTRAHLPPQAITDNLLRLSKEQALRHGPKYVLLTLTESLRGYFWEGGNSLLQTLMAAATFFALLYCVFSLGRLPGLIRHMVAIIFFFIFFYSFFDILPRHMLPLAPLYLISITYCLYSILSRY